MTHEGRPGGRWKRRSDIFEALLVHSNPHCPRLIPGEHPEWEIAGAGVQVIFLRAGSNPSQVRRHLGRLSRIRQEESITARRYISRRGFESSGTREADEQAIDLAFTSVSALDDVLDVLNFF